MNNENKITFPNFLANILVEDSSSVMATEIDFDDKFEKELNKEVINDVSKKVKINRTNGFLFSFFIPYSVIEHSRESFIGCISDEEAEKMKKEVALFKKSFDEDLNRRNKILFRR